MNNQEDNTIELRERLAFKAEKHNMPLNIYEGEGKPNIEHFVDEVMALIQAINTAARMDERKGFSKALYKVGVDTKTSVMVLAELKELKSNE